MTPKAPALALALSLTACFDGGSVRAPNSPCMDGTCAPTAAWVYTEFTPFGPCSVGCGMGVQTRVRQCLTTEGEPAPCETCGGVCEQTITCMASDTCAYSAWAATGSCGAACDRGTQRYERQCLDPDGNALACSFCGGECEKEDVCACATCGDGTVQPGTGETCDAGALRTDAPCKGCCRTSCQWQSCGDGIVDPSAGEACDNGADNTDGACVGPNCCRTDCTAPRCGDGVLDAARGEACDDGPSNVDASCSGCCRKSCEVQSCGDGVVDALTGELCDRGEANSDAGCTGPGCCRTTCVAPSCGDGITDAYLGETCDAGEANTDQSCAGCCRTACRVQRCGDMIVDLEAGEECDDGNLDAADGCSSCRIAERARTGLTPSVAMGANGLSLFAWYDPSTARVNGEWHDADGMTGRFDVYAGAPTSLEVSMAQDGGALLAWNAVGHWQGVQFVRLPARSTVTPSVGYVATSSAGTKRVSASMSRNENFVLGWDIGPEGDGDVIVDPYDYNVTSRGSAHASLAPSGDERALDVALDDGGRAVLVWAAPDGSGSGVFAQCIDATSSSVAARVLNTTDLVVNQTLTGDQHSPVVAVQRRAALGEASGLVVWRNDAGSNLLMRRLRVTSSGCSLVGADQLVTASGSGAEQPAVAMDAAGSAVVVWVASGSIYAQRYDVAGVPAWPEPVRVSVLTGATRPAVAMDPNGNGRFVVGWAGAGQSMFFQRLTPAGGRVHDGPWSGPTLDEIPDDQLSGPVRDTTGGGLFD